VFIAEVSKDGKLQIPAELQAKYGIFPGMKLRLADENGVITLRPLLKDVLKEIKNNLDKEKERLLSRQNGWAQSNGDTIFS
jgi:bifunctional DNA-binding transcriptional regulator/antitoxin component of YhaV-PrlF toxin-antitoxin module